MLYIAPKLTTYNRNTRMLKYFEALEKDPEPGIRTNTVICICKLLPLFDERGQKEVYYLYLYISYIDCNSNNCSRVKRQRK